jgi:hypothetical protein
MSLPEVPYSIHLERRLDGTSPTGHASLAGDDPRAFSGWVGLVCTVEELVNAERATTD